MHGRNSISTRTRFCHQAGVAAMESIPAGASEAAKMDAKVTAEVKDDRVLPHSSNKIPVSVSTRITLRQTCATSRANGKSTPGYRRTVQV